MLKRDVGEAGEDAAVLERLGLGDFAQGPMAGDNGWVLPRGSSGAVQSGAVEMTEFLPREEHAGERGGLPSCWFTVLL
jgi:hypothetical protein